MIKFSSQNNSIYTTYSNTIMGIGGVTLILFITSCIVIYVKIQLARNLELIHKIQSENNELREKIMKTDKKHLEHINNIEDKILNLQNDIKKFETDLVKYNETSDKFGIRMEEQFEFILKMHHETRIAEKHEIEKLKIKIQKENEKIKSEITENIYKIQTNIEANMKYLSKNLLTQLDQLNLHQQQDRVEFNTQLKNVSNGFTIIPYGSGFCNTEVEEILFHATYVNLEQFNHVLGTQYADIKIYEGKSYDPSCSPNIILNSMKLYCNDKTNANYAIHFMKQFKKIKSIYFDIDCAIMEAASAPKNQITGQQQELMTTLFHEIVKMNPCVKIHYKCKHPWSDYDPKSVPTIVNEFTKTTHYISFDLEIEHNLQLDKTTGGTKYISLSKLSTNIKEHCVNNNIEFTSNIRL
jgi:hypothetical protein